MGRVKHSKGDSMDCNSHQKFFAKPEIGKTTL